jgi:hypothetical protein
MGAAKFFSGLKGVANQKSLKKTNIFFSTEWRGNPVLISVETTDYPIENIIFPTVTTCREENEPNCFYFFAKLFDYLPFPCFDDG